jgi:hypothetical protein
MSKHVITTRDPAVRVELNWQPDGGVQIATARWVGDGPPDPDGGYLTGGAEEPGWDGRFGDLSRGDLNHLVRYLRMARDQAFGRDQ